MVCLSPVGQWTYSLRSLQHRNNRRRYGALVGSPISDFLQRGIPGSEPTSYATTVVHNALELMFSGVRRIPLSSFPLSSLATRVHETPRVRTEVGMRRRGGVDVTFSSLRRWWRRRRTRRNANRLNGGQRKERRVRDDLRPQGTAAGIPHHRMFNQPKDLPGGSGGGLGARHARAPSSGGRGMKGMPSSAPAPASGDALWMREKAPRCPDAMCRGSP